MARTEVFVERLTIACETCERLWTLGAQLSFYEQQALESRPCPHCGAYTLTCQEPAAETAPAGRWQSTMVY